MIIRIDAASTVLEDPDVFTAFSIVASDDAPLEQLGAVADDRAHVFVESALVRMLADEAGASPDWDEGFDAMADYADSKGWTDDAGRIRAHVERAQ